MDRHTRSKSFFADKDLKENPTFEKFRNEIERKFNQLAKKRKFCRTKPLKQSAEKFQVEHIKLKNVRLLDFSYIFV